ncbi:hypothetical protein CQA57_05680 [Helicobacter anseris]|uniref:Uncharacterized protein n=1 Tax=Helicobacter anseris TaxID=375926 RepID=A0A3D8J747_9HELI|nr:hypothetical protein [Helicobacter anseris]RDU73015.1 hypothetical protein CQA57_05680 [Helicobacter anseris]
MLLDFFINNFSVFFYNEWGVGIYYCFALIQILLCIFLIVLFFAYERCKKSKYFIFKHLISAFGLIFFVFFTMLLYSTARDKSLMYENYSIEKLYSEGLISKKTFDHFYPKVMKERLEAEKEAEAKAKEEEERKEKWNKLSEEQKLEKIAQTRTKVFLIIPCMMMIVFFVYKISDFMWSQHLANKITRKKTIISNIAMTFLLVITFLLAYYGWTLIFP